MQESRLIIIGWINEDELPDNYPYDDMFEFSKIDVVRMFPVFAPESEKLKHKRFHQFLRDCSEEVSKWPEWKRNAL